MNLLVLATEPVDAELLRDALGDEAEGAQVLVVSPAVNSSPLAFWVSDSDEAIAGAQETLDTTLASLRESGMRARGTTGESEPLLALEDALATYPADKVVIFDEADLVEEARERLDVPVVAGER